jgi:two-component system aerobic respiration control protein ArcA
MAKKFHTKDLVDKIDRITKARIAQEKVISLDQFRQLKKVTTPPVLLVIEDDETMRKALSRIFEDDGYRVLTAADGTQLSKVLDDSPLDIILLDVGLPWVNGFELAQLMKEHQDLKSIPLIFISGRSSEADIKKGFAVGCDDYITKPFDIEKVKRAVATLMKLCKVVNSLLLTGVQIIRIRGEVGMDIRNHHRTLADGRGHAFYGTGPDVSDRIHAGP